jgi:hypothetical protein
MPFLGFFHSKDTTKSYKKIYDLVTWLFWAFLAKKASQLILQRLIRGTWKTSVNMATGI